MLPEGTLLKNSGGCYSDELRFKLLLVNEILINWDSGDLFVSKALTNQLWSFLPSK